MVSARMYIVIAGAIIFILITASFVSKVAFNVDFVCEIIRCETSNTENLNTKGILDVAMIDDGNVSETFLMPMRTLSLPSNAESTTGAYLIRNEISPLRVYCTYFDTHTDAIAIDVSSLLVDTDQGERGFFIIREVNRARGTYDVDMRVYRKDAFMYDMNPMCPSILEPDWIFFTNATFTVYVE